MSWNESSYVSADVRDVRVTAFLSKVYGWMFLGLLITAGIAFGVASSPALIETLILNQILFWILFLAPIGLVWYLAAKVDKIAPATAAGTVCDLLRHGRSNFLRGASDLHGRFDCFGVCDYVRNVWRDGSVWHGH